MPADANIYANLLRQPKSVQDYDALAMQSQSNMLALDEQRMKAAALKQAQADDLAYKNAVKGFGGDVEANYRTLISAGLPKHAADYQKAALEGREKQAKIGKEEGESLDAGIKRYREQLSYIESPEAAARWYQAQYADPVVGKFLSGYGTIDQALKEIPSDPAAFKMWRDQIGMGLDAFNKKLATDREFSLKANNEIIGPDGKVNTTLLNAKKQVAQAGAARTNVNVNTDKTLTSTMAKGLGEQLDSSLAGANAAVNTISTANQIRDLVSTGNIVTGPGADYRIGVMRLGDMLGVGGKDTQEKLANTSALVQSLAKTELDAAAGMKGQGQITDAERAILRRAAAGELNMSPAELITLSNAMDKTARSRITSHQTRVQQLKAVPGTDSLIPFYSVEMPGQYKPKQSGGNVDLHSAAEAIIKGGK